jgi:hypothetical protein
MQYLPRLRSLTLRLDPSSDDEWERQLDNMADLSPFLLIPSLRTLRCEGLRFYDTQHNESYPRPVTKLSDWLKKHSHSNVQEFYLYNCAVGGNDFLPLINFMPGLQRFHYTAVDPWGGVHCDSMASLIRENRTSWRELRFDLMPDTERARLHSWCKVHDQPWCDLSSMTALEVVGFPALLLHEKYSRIPPEHRRSPLSWMLPCQNLHTLELREYGWSEDLLMVQEALRALINDERFSTLTRIELSTNNDWNKPVPEFPQEMLLPGWSAATIDRSLHVYLSLTVLTRTGT